MKAPSRVHHLAANEHLNVADHFLKRQFAISISISQANQVFCLQKSIVWISWINVSLKSREKLLKTYVVYNCYLHMYSSFCDTVITDCHIPDFAQE